MRLRRYDEAPPTSDQRQAFECGHESLDRWLATQAGQSMKSRDAVTYLLWDEQAIAGYYCLSAGSVSREEAPPAIAKRAPDPVPVIRMGRFAVHRSYQGQGWGRDLLREAIRSAAAALDGIGARAMLVDAIDESAQTFYLKNGFIASPAAPRQLMLRLDVAKLSDAAAQATPPTGV